MLLKIELENFFSIKDTVCLDFTAANINTATSKELSDNVIEWNDTKILKTIGLFGPNASGKSNIIKAIRFCCSLILESHNHNEGVVFNFVPFKFDGYDKQPSRFFIDFVCENTEYEYSFTLTRTEILSETLHYYPNGRRAKIFTRDENAKEKFSFSEGVINRPFDVAANTSRKNLYLSRASSMGRPLFQKLYTYFFKTFLLGLLNLNDKHAEELFVQYKSVVLEALSICDSDISDIELIHEKINVPVPMTFTPNMSNVFEKEVIRVLTTHKKSKKIKFDMATEESSGTVQLFNVLLRLLDVVQHGKSILLDEFDASLHTRLADFIIDLIHASKNAQLLFTSHNTNLIDVKRFRRDQIIFVNKKDDGSTEVYSLYDYKDFRENMDAEKGYIQGRFDAVPFVDSSVGNLKKLMGLQGKKNGKK